MREVGNEVALFASLMEGRINSKEEARGRNQCEQAYPAGSATDCTSDDPLLTNSDLDKSIHHLSKMSRGMQYEGCFKGSIV